MSITTTLLPCRHTNGNKSGEKITSILDVERILNSRNYNDPISIEIINNKNITERFNFR